MCGRETAMTVNYKATGFTLIELAIVIILLAILSVYVSISFTDSPNLYAQAKLLANDIRYAQSLSMTHGERYSFVKLSPASYAIQHGSSVNIVMPNGSTSVSFGTGIAFGTLSGFTSTIVFDSRGMPYADSNTTPMSSTAIIPLTKDNQTAFVTINPETGRVSP